MDEIASSVMEVKDLDEETIWDLIESQRHIITNSVRPCHITPFLRQCHVIGETDEEEILFAPHLKHRCMRTGKLSSLHFMQLFHFFQGGFNCFGWKWNTSHFREHFFSRCCQLAT